MDEMDLVSRLKDVPPLRPEAYERGRAMLGAAMAESQAGRAPGTTPVRHERSSWARNLRVGVLGKIGIGVAGAAAVAVAVVAATAAGPAVPGDSSPPPAAAPAVDSRLVTLATSVKTSSGSLPGDASLVVRTTTAPDGKPYVTYNLYTDSGEMYVTDTKDQLAGAINRNDNLADPSDARVLAAARYAATGDLAKAREQIINSIPNAWGLGLSAAEAQKAWDKGEVERRKLLQQKGIADPPHRPRPTGKALEDGINNHLWAHCLSALTGGAANPEVRAGVLRLISTIPDVAVTTSTTGGQPALVLTAGPALFAGHSEHVLTINADTGLPISSETRPAPGATSQDAGPPAVATYQSSRVTVADIKTGRF
jgi:hypothetical protein